MVAKTQTSSAEIIHSTFVQPALGFKPTVVTVICETPIIKRRHGTKDQAKRGIQDLAVRRHPDILVNGLWVPGVVELQDGDPLLSGYAAHFMDPFPLSDEVL